MLCKWEYSRLGWEIADIDTYPPPLATPIGDSLHNGIIMPTIYHLHFKAEINALIGPITNNRPQFAQSAEERKQCDVLKKNTVIDKGS